MTPPFRIEIWASAFLSKGPQSPPRPHEPWFSLSIANTISFPEEVVTTLTNHTRNHGPHVPAKKLLNGREVARLRGHVGRAS